MGYVLTQFAGGYLADRFGGKWVFGACTLGSSVVGTFVPTAANIHPTLLVFTRALQGVFQGPTFPCAYSMAAKWFPAEEKTRMMSIILTGNATNFFWYFALMYISFLRACKWNCLGHADGWDIGQGGQLGEHLLH